MSSIEVKQIAEDEIESFMKKLDGLHPVVCGNCKNKDLQ